MRSVTDRGAIANVVAPIHRQGIPFVAFGGVLTLVMGVIWMPLFWIGLIATGWTAYFFRDPVRVSPVDRALVLSPADGLVTSVRTREPPPELEMGGDALPCVSIFLNIVDVHINRTPVAGRVLRRVYHPGTFLNAALDKASEVNERQSFLIETETGQRVGCVQIAGLIARRIVAFVDTHALVQVGQRIGLIRFGSRCDVYLPQGVVPLVLEGQRAVAGETVIARLEGEQLALQGLAS